MQITLRTSNPCTAKTIYYVTNSVQVHGSSVPIHISHTHGPLWWTVYHACETVHPLENSRYKVHWLPPHLNSFPSPLSCFPSNSLSLFPHLPLYLSSSLCPSLPLFPFTSFKIPVPPQKGASKGRSAPGVMVWTIQVSFATENRACATATTRPDEVEMRWT